MLSVSMFKHVLYVIQYLQQSYKVGITTMPILHVSLLRLRKMKCLPLGHKADKCIKGQKFDYTFQFCLSYRHHVSENFKYETAILIVTNKMCITQNMIPSSIGIVQVGIALTYITGVLGLLIFLLCFAQCVIASPLLCLHDGCCISGHFISSQKGER